MKTIKDIMSPHIPEIYAHTELTEIVAQLHKHHVFGSPVINQNKQLIGFISEQHLLEPLIQNSYFCNGQTTAQVLMTTGVLSVESTLSVLDLALQMQGNKPKVYPVVSDNKVIGIVTRSQVITALKAEYLKCK